VEKYGRQATDGSTEHFTVEQVMKAQMGGKDIALLFL
jgi:hypothetical protein